MWRFGRESESKSQLVADICSISTSTTACPHRRHCNPAAAAAAAATSPFVDWYRILGVAEDATTDAIRKRYHKLALQLHPDKNKHRKAEVAFKLVSEANACLSDSLRRRTFDLERMKHFCTKCNRSPYVTCNTFPGLLKPKLEPWDLAKGSRSFRLDAFQDIRDRFREETRVIQNCLRTNSLSRIETQPSYIRGSPNQNTVTQSSQKESPIFDPSNYKFHRYPHLRSQVHKKPGNFWNFWKGSPKTCEQGGDERETPILGNASIRQIFKSKAASVH